MTRKAGKGAGKGTGKGTRKATKTKKTSPSRSRRTRRAPVDLSPVDVGGDAVLLTILEREHPDLLREIRAEAAEDGLTVEQTVVRALRDAYGLPERFEATFVVHVCPECASRRDVER